MATPFSAVIDRFFNRIEEDRDFFEYYSLSDTEAMQLASRRAAYYLRNAIDRVMLDGMPDIDLTDIDEPLAQFNQDLTTREIFLLSSLMYEYYLEKDIAKIRIMDRSFTPTELRVFDASNTRLSFKALYDGVCANNLNLLDSYRNTDRLSGAFKSIDYASYGDEGQS